MLKPALIKLIAVLCLVVQAWAGGGSICLGSVLSCGAAQATQESGGRSCCDRDHSAPSKPAPHDPERCPPGCDCCISVPASDKTSPVEFRMDFDRAVAAAVTLYYTGFVPAFELAPAAMLTGIPPPDRPDSALCLKSTRLLI